ncbi:hypothetical protein B0I31_11443 [Saccharothrix carnea]|uniref:LPXTG-motif cell wall-anchored protein n=1 Tax=Saccharothrix carnea TaxID=1280637 RepID=A0A2P8I184_SACCR|nr:hypothetical protein [Saccharothrix carnea]PSL52216.1 hypothetical protein B0I31_11443 [Saccharothrix carnea]
MSPLRVFALLALLLAFAPGTAHAAPLGGLVVTPGESRDAAPVRLATSAGCPREATGYAATMHGAGLPAEGLVIVANGDVGLTHDRPFEVPVALTFQDLAADHDVTFSGPYELRLHCIDAFTQQVYGDFTGTVDFVEPARYVAVGAAKGPQQPTAPLIVPAPDPGLAPPPSSDVPAEQPTGQPADQPAAEAAAQGTPTGSGGGQPLLYVAIGVVGALALVGAGSYLRRRRTR